MKKKKNKNEGQLSLRTRMVDAREYIGVLRELIGEGKTVSLVITGSSMSPFLIHQRDAVILAPIDTPLERGDMAMFQRANGQYVLHRICRKEGEAYYFVGDAQNWIEGPISREQIFGRVTAVRRGGVWIHPGDFWWEFFEHVWLRMIPLRQFAVGLYGAVYRIRGGGRKTPDRKE